MAKKEKNSRVRYISPAEMLERKTQLALKNGTLRAMCEKTYGAKYVEKNFCTDCQYREACKMMKGVENGSPKTPES